MKSSRFSDSQIIAILKQAEGGSPVPGLGLLSTSHPKSCIGAGLQAIGLLLRLLRSARPRQRKA